jgi:hypothetical protein
MASPAQQLANAANAQRSTGPRTLEGKAVVSKNATKHCLSAGRAAVFPHEREEYGRFRVELLRSLAPVGALEEIVFEQLADAAWGLRRLRLLELEMYENSGHADPLLLDECAAAMRQLDRYRARANRSFYDAVAQLRRLQADRALRAGLLTEEEDAQLPVLADPRKCAASQPQAHNPSHGFALPQEFLAQFAQSIATPPGVTFDDKLQYLAEEDPELLEQLPHLRQYLAE